MLVSGSGPTACRRALRSLTMSARMSLCMMSLMLLRTLPGMSALMSKGAGLRTMRVVVFACPRMLMFKPPLRFEVVLVSFGVKSSTRFAVACGPAIRVVPWRFVPVLISRLVAVVIVLIAAVIPTLVAARIAPVGAMVYAVICTGRYTEGNA